jgi:hypothetical protein
MNIYRKEKIELIIKKDIQKYSNLLFSKKKYIILITLHYGGKNVDFTYEEITTPGKHYDTMCKIPSDINEHLPTLKKYAEECDSVTEMGVRFGCSTWAFIEAKPKKITSLDIYYESFKPSEPYVKILCDKYGIDFIWITGDSLKIQIEETDLLFIDTLHTYNQLSGELFLHSRNVKKYIILHDTTTFGYVDETIYETASDLIRGKISPKVGLKPALSEFLDKNSNWSIKETFTNNNGLTILQRLD